MTNTMKLTTGTTMKRTTDVATYSFGGEVSIEAQHAARTKAWGFMRACEAAKLSAGYPSLKAPYTVQVGIATNSDRDVADALADGAPVVDYAFAGSEYTL